jgi:hypothetical protein
MGHNQQRLASLVDPIRNLVGVGILRVEKSPFLRDETDGVFAPPPDEGTERPLARHPDMDRAMALRMYSRSVSSGMP